MSTLRSSTYASVMDKTTAKPGSPTILSLTLLSTLCQWALPWSISLSRLSSDVSKTQKQQVFVGLSSLENAHTKTSEIFSSMMKMFIIQFINTGLVIFLVNAQFGITIGNFPVFAG
jgi:hypothetical protein